MEFNGSKEKRKLEIVIKRIGWLTKNTEANPHLTYEKAELSALCWLVSEYERLKKLDAVEENYGNK